jgi:uncharacterized protein YaaQ
MKKSGLADSPFFAVPANPTALTPPPEMPSPLHRVKDIGEKNEVKKKLRVSKHASNQGLMQVSNHASMQTGMQESIIEIIRKAVKDAGKESATYRFTPEEKKALLELTFTYKVQGFKTSENELTRIAINFILEDHKQNGRNSVLEKVLQALNK